MVTGQGVDDSLTSAALRMALAERGGVAGMGAIEQCGTNPIQVSVAGVLNRYGQRTA
jgi:hypothetical protein